MNMWNLSIIWTQIFHEKGPVNSIGSLRYNGYTNYITNTEEDGSNNNFFVISSNTFPLGPFEVSKC